MTIVFRAAALALCLTGMPAAAIAAPPACTCQNLESLQQDYQNAVYLEAYKRALAAHLRAIETPLLEARVSNPGSYEATVDISSRTGPAEIAFESQNFHLPFGQVTGYTGPKRVNMTFGTCEQPQPDLDALRDGSPCAAMAEAALDHERRHRETCARMGAGAYWARLASEIALEEAEHYRIQAAALKEELRRVLEAAEVKIEGEWRHTVDAQGMMTATYFFQTLSGDIGGASGGDRWTMAGQGETSNQIEAVAIAGMNCTASGAVRAQYDVALTTDGLTFGLEVAQRRASGDLALRCPRGMAMSLPSADSASGTFATGQPLVAGRNPLPNDWAETIKAMMSSGGVSISGDPDVALVVSCPAP